MGPFLRKILKSLELFTLVPLPYWSHFGILIGTLFFQILFIGLLPRDLIFCLFVFVFAGPLTATMAMHRMTMKEMQIICLKNTWGLHPALIIFAQLWAILGFLLSRWPLCQRNNNCPFSFYLRIMNNKNYILHTCLI